MPSINGFPPPQRFYKRGLWYSVGQIFKDAKVIKLPGRPNDFFVRTKTGLVGKIAEEGQGLLSENQRVSVEIVDFQCIGFGAGEKVHVNFRLMRPEIPKPTVISPKSAPVPQPQAEPEIESLSDKDLLSYGKKLNRKAIGGIDKELTTIIDKWVIQAEKAIGQYVIEVEMGWTKELVGHYSLYRNLADRAKTFRLKLGKPEINIEVPQYCGMDFNHLPENRPRR